MWRTSLKVPCPYSRAGSPSHGAFFRIPSIRSGEDPTGKQVGVSTRIRDDVQAEFDKEVSTAGGVQLPDGRVFLADIAFYQAGYLASFVYKDADLSGIIVHELLHRAGLTDAQIIPLHQQIQENCGIPGYAIGAGE